MADPDKPNNLLISGFVVGAVVFLVGLVYGVDQMFRMLVTQEVAVKVLAVPNSQLRQLHAEEDQRLTHYQWADEKKGVVRIPLDRGMDLTLRDWKSRPTAPVPVEVAQNLGLLPPAPAKPVPAAAPQPAGGKGP